MSVGGTQTLTVEGSRPGVSYAWEIASGGGSLSSSHGISVVYTAPETNPDCARNPKINLLADGSRCASLSIAVNGYTENSGAVDWDRGTCACVSIGCDCWHIHRYYRCNGILGEGQNTGWGGEYPGMTCGPGNEGECCWESMTDIRTAGMKGSGCCPVQLLPEEPPPPACDLEVNSFAGTAMSLHPFNGGTVSFSGNVASSRPFHWTVIVSGRKIGEGTGGSVSAFWDGKDISGKVVKPGKHTVTLSVTTDDGQCSAGRDLTLTVKVSGETDCKLLVDFGSFANLAAGGLHHAQTLFRVPGSRWMPDLTLSYSSTEGCGEVLGTGWTHTYNERLSQGTTDDTYLYVKGTGIQQVLHRKGDVYTPEDATYPTLIRNADGSFMLQEKNLGKRIFDASGNLTALEDRNGNAVSLAYDGNGRLESVSDPAGRTVAFAYDAGGRIASVTDPNGNVHAFTYSGEHLVRVSSPDASKTRIWSYAYDALGFLVTKTDPDGNKTRYVYDENHRIRETVDPEGKTRTAAYDPAANTTRFVEKDGGVWIYAYDTTLGVLTEKTDPLGKTTRYEYDGRSNLTRKTGADGTSTAYTYDENDNVLTATDALGNVTSFAYNALNLVTSVTDARGKTTSYDYDVRGNLASATDPSGGTRQYQYDGRGNAEKITDPLGNIMQFAYDAAGKPVFFTDPEGNATQLAYDSLGNLTVRTDALGNKTRFQYDHLNRLAGLTDPLGGITLFAYDFMGNRTSITDANGLTTRYAYNSRNQVIRITDSLGNATTMTYGAAACPGCGGADRLTAVTDAKNQRTTYEYDLAGMLIKETDPLGNVTTYAYDIRGNLAAKIKPDGKAIAYAYDASNRLIQKQYSDGSVAQYQYDDAGNMTYAGNRHIAYRFDYDANNRITEITDTGAGVIQYGYDAAGRRTSMTTPEGSYIQYVYNANSLLSGITAAGGYRTNDYAYRYDALNRRVRRDLPNGTKTIYRYDANSRLTEIVQRDPRNRVAGEIKYAHDSVGNRIEKTIDGEAIRYAYDAIYRLASAEPVGRGRKHLYGHIDEAYAYDPVGNRITGPRPQDLYTYDAGNELLTDRRHRYEYDPNGHLVRKTRTDHDGQIRTTEFAYDDDSRLVKVTIRKRHKIREITYAYDPFGRRISKTIHRDEIGDDEADGGGTGTGNDRCGGGDKAHPRTTTYLYDGSGIIAEHNNRNELTRRYLHGPGIDEPLSVTEIKGHGKKDLPETYYYQVDGLGSITGLTDEKGRPVQRYEYDSFGNIRQHGNRIGQPFAFTAREYDRETGLYFYRARYYDPQSGRFIVRDPIGFAGGDINLYAYVWNNPVNWRDPLGIYGYSVHFDDTQTMALQTGFNPRRAYELAKYSNAVDEKYPVWSYENRLKWHFTTKERVDELLQKAYSTGSNKDFGEALHVLQDYYSHTLQGYGPVLGHGWTGEPDDPATNWDLYFQMRKDVRNAMEMFLKSICK